MSDVIETEDDNGWVGGEAVKPLEIPDRNNWAGFDEGAHSGRSIARAKVERRLVRA